MEGESPILAETPLAGSPSECEQAPSEISQDALLLSTAGRVPRGRLAGVQGSLLCSACEQRGCTTGAHQVLPGWLGCVL